MSSRASRWLASRGRVRNPPAGAFRSPETGARVAPRTLEHRLRAVRKKRIATRRGLATTLALWIAGLGALLTVVSGALFRVHQ